LPKLFGDVKLFPGHGGKNDVLGIPELSPSGRSNDYRLLTEESGIRERISERDPVSFQ
jgi:hypothetical protein